MVGGTASGRGRNVFSKGQRKWAWDNAQHKMNCPQRTAAHVIIAKRKDKGMGREHRNLPLKKEVR